MKKSNLLLVALQVFSAAQSQNVGIGTNAPTGPLSFANQYGNKVVFYGDGSLFHFGIGVQNAVLQLYGDVGSSNIAFGYGRSGTFVQRMRIMNGGSEGMELAGRMTLRNGTNPVDANAGPGIWMYKADNSGLLGLFGVKDNQNIGFFGGPGNWGFTYNALNSRVGIGNNNPNAPLAFAADLGKKITLYPGASGDVGLGVSGNLLQIFSDKPDAAVAIGYDAAGTFNERMRIINTGGEGMDLNGRMTLRNGTSPLDISYGPGIWMFKADNTSALGFVGVQNNQNMGFYGGPGGWGFTYNALNSRVGIGNNNPNAPLAFAPLLGKKITLYPGATGDVGFGVAGNRLQIYSDNPNADVAIGYDAAGTFNERFSFKPNGAMAVGGDLGAAGFFLRSNGNAAATWSSPTNELYQKTVSIKGVGLVDLKKNILSDIPGLNYTFSLIRNAKVLVYFDIASYTDYCLACGPAYVRINLNLDGNDLPGHSYKLIDILDETLIGHELLQVAPGNHTIKLKATFFSGPNVSLGAVAGAAIVNNMIVQIIPE